ncbi:GntR family transcriptional regulator [Pseudomonas straminea]|uniref:DNA-binding transcriptional regulator, GntR family n=1 Tax=Pseudomonas straminea TaxID=47882 RepID=A0A1I1XFE4_PSEOC|nr:MULTISPECIES: GntR family transcriptional regulator [Pseudomonas]TWE05439.1 GntR family transcriptional regulator [Pseudomonas sp. AG1028]GLX15262.1 GntR family transcriptional regulator [Pseudomonas straminea]SFE04090.1 DNA-binding transcriptional regulator, GntR family [Pseudomonas straminea]
MKYPIDGLSHTYLGSGVYALLREALITGRFQPDDRLRIRDLAEQLGTSVTPVRDAILQLAKEKALILKTPRDIRVPVLSQAQYAEIRNIRLALEGLAAETAAAKVSAEQLQMLERNIRDNLKAVHDGDLIAALKLNQAFHFALAEIADMPLLRDVLDSLWMRTGPLIALAYGDFNERMAIEHHWEVFHALQKGDGEAARQAICTDILDGNQLMTAFIAKREATVA